MLIASQLTNAHPDVPEYRCQLGANYSSLGEALLAQGNHVEAEQSYRQAVEQQQTAFTKCPEVFLFRVRLSASYAGLALTLRAQMRANEAAAVARRRMELWKDNPIETYNVARELSLCVPIARDNSIKQALEAEAVEVLRRAVETGWRDALQTCRDANLAPLRSRDDFRRLVAELLDGIFPADPFQH
jgi:tetratricopeptide (TPR) repeat protein